MAIVTGTLAEQDLDWGLAVVEKVHPSGGTLNENQINLTSLSTRMGLNNSADTKTWDPGAVATNSSTSTTVTVNGASLGDFVMVSFSLSLGGLQLSAYVSATNTVTVTLYNNTGGSVNLASGTIRVLVFKVR